MNLAPLFSLLRQLVTVFGVVLASYGVSEAQANEIVSQLEVIAGAAFTLVGVGASVYAAIRRSRKQEPV